MHPTKSKSKTKSRSKSKKRQSTNTSSANAVSHSAEPELQFAEEEYSSSAESSNHGSNAGDQIDSLSHSFSDSDEEGSSTSSSTNSSANVSPSSSPLLKGILIVRNGRPLSKGYHQSSSDRESSQSDSSPQQRHVHWDESIPSTDLEEEEAKARLGCSVNFYLSLSDIERRGIHKTSSHSGHRKNKSKKK